VSPSHEQLGHVSEELTRKISQDLGWQNFKWTMNVCKVCTVAKAQQKNVVKASIYVQFDSPVERVFPDLARIMQPNVLRQYWRIILETLSILRNSVLQDFATDFVAFSIYQQ
jgi:hypothetical protein